MKASLKQNFITNENLNDDIFYNSLAEELNNIIEEELSKNYEDINAELIDDCCLALNEIYELQNAEFKNSEKIININTIIKKHNLQNRKKFVVAAACAAIAAFTVGTTIFTLGNKTVVFESELIKSAVGKFEDIFNQKEPATTEPTTAETTTVLTTEQITQQTTNPTTTEVVLEIRNITLIAPPGFYSTFTSRDEINLNNFYISVNYANGEKEVVPISAGSYEICKPQADGTTEIKVYYKGFTISYYVTVIPEEKLNPVIVTSIYGAFEKTYTVDDMRVFAVLSDGSEKEIQKSDCTITTEEFSDGDETGVIVTVEYENCSFQFLSE
ncbi:MAG: hypothetical protein IJ025_04200 [Clostridia bacterium]|nr:hypothetical protein [Clostridia bacterium]